MIEKPCPEALMAGPLGGWLEDQSSVRDEARLASSKRLSNLCFVALPIYAFLWVFLELPTVLMIVGGIFAAVAGYGWSEIPKSRAKKRVKQGINEAIAQAVGLQYEAECAPGSGFTMAKLYKMLPSFERSCFEDRWSGQVGGLNFCLHEATLEERRGSGKSRRWVTTFHGVIMTVGFRRSFHGTTMVVRNNTHRKIFGGAKNTIKLAGEHLQYCRMVDPKFEDAFDVYATDPVEARYLVHPEYVERLAGIEDSFGGQDICALFQGGELVIVLKTPNLFESGSINRSDDRARIEGTVEQFGKLADLANMLNEDQRPGERPMMQAEQPTFGQRDTGAMAMQTAAMVAAGISGGVAAAVVGDADPVPSADTLGGMAGPPAPAANLRRPGGFGRKGL